MSLEVWFWKVRTLRDRISTCEWSYARTSSSTPPAPESRFERHDLALEHSRSRQLLAGAEPDLEAAADLEWALVDRLALSRLALGKRRGERARVGQAQVVLNSQLPDTAAQIGVDLRAVDEDRVQRYVALGAGRAHRVQPRDRQLTAAPQPQWVVDAVCLGDRAPPRRVAVRVVGDRRQRVAVANRVCPQPGDRPSGRVLRLARRAGLLGLGQLEIDERPDRLAVGAKQRVADRDRHRRCLRQLSPSPS